MKGSVCIGQSPVWVLLYCFGPMLVSSVTLFPRNEAMSELQVVHCEVRPSSVSKLSFRILRGCSKPSLPGGGKRAFSFSGTVHPSRSPSGACWKSGMLEVYSYWRFFNLHTLVPKYIQMLKGATAIHLPSFLSRFPSPASLSSCEVMHNLHVVQLLDEFTHLYLWLHFSKI